MSQRSRNVDAARPERHAGPRRGPGPRQEYWSLLLAIAAALVVSLFARA